MSFCLDFNFFIGACLSIILFVVSIRVDRFGSFCLSSRMSSHSVSRKSRIKSSLLNFEKSLLYFIFLFCLKFVFISRIANCSKWSEIAHVRLPEICETITFVKMLSISVLLCAVIRVGFRISGISEFEEVNSRKFSQSLFESKFIRLILKSPSMKMFLFSVVSFSNVGLR